MLWSASLAFQNKSMFGAGETKATCPLRRRCHDASTGTGVDHDIGLAATIRRLIPIIKTIHYKSSHHIKLEFHPNSAYLPNDGVIAFVPDRTKPANRFSVRINHYSLKKGWLRQSVSWHEIWNETSSYLPDDGSTQV
jgi:hypothetical protein